MRPWNRAITINRGPMDAVRAPKKIIVNNRGMISADFIFSLTLCVWLCIVFFGLSFTLAMSEVAQYISFSTARAFSAGHLDTDKQNTMGFDKFKELVNRPVLKELFANSNGSSWFTLDQPIIKNGFNGENFNSDYPGVEVPQWRVPLIGVKTVFKPNLLNLKIPFLGSTTENQDQGFSAKVTSFLIREPSAKECLDQMKVRNDEILKLSSRYNILGGKVSPTSYVALEDNGC